MSGVLTRHDKTGRSNSCLYINSCSFKGGHIMLPHIVLSEKLKTYIRSKQGVLTIGNFYVIQG